MLRIQTWSYKSGMKFCPHGNSHAVIEQAQLIVFNAKKL